MADIAGLQKILGLVFKNPALVEVALVHSSYVNENPSWTAGNNERLEFLGDAVLDFVIAEKIYQDFPDMNEGDLTRLRASLVCGETLARIARNIWLGSYLIMGKGEEATGGRNKIPNLAGAFEALIAAVYLDLGMNTVRELIIRLYTEEWKNLTSHGVNIDYKSKLQEIAQAKFQEIPVYRLVSETGPDHNKQFNVEVIINSRVMGSGAGKSKKIAEMAAAKQALQSF